MDANSFDRTTDKYFRDGLLVRKLELDLSGIQRLSNNGLIIKGLFFAVELSKMAHEAVQKESLSFRPRGEILPFIQISQSLRSFEMTNMA
jgi:hypothetical protein